MVKTIVVLKKTKKHRDLLPPTSFKLLSLPKEYRVTINQLLSLPPNVLDRKLNLYLLQKAFCDPSSIF